MRDLFNVAVNATGESAARLCFFIANVIIARQLGPTEFGNWSISLAILGLALVICDVGAGAYGVTEVAKTKASLLAKKTGEIVATRLTCWILVLLTFGLYAGIFNPPFASPTLVMMAGLVFFTLNQDWVLRARGKIELSALSQIIASASFLAVVSLTLTSIEHAAYFRVMSLLLASAVCIAALKVTEIPFPVLKPPTRSYFLAALPIVSSLLIARFYLSSDVLFISYLITIEAAGSYAAIAMLYTALLMLRGSIISALLPSYTRSDTREMIRKCLRWTAIMVGAGFTLTAPIFMFGEELVAQIFSREFATPQNMQALNVLMMSAIVLFAGTCCSVYLLARQMRYHYLSCTVAALIVNTALNLLLIPRVGIVGAAYSTLAAEATAIAIALFTCARGLTTETRKNNDSNKLQRLSQH